MTAILAGVIVTILWSSSYILNEWAFDEGIGPLTLAGTRYVVASFMLMMVMKGIGLFQTNDTRPYSSLKWRYILIIGLTGFTMAQGLQYAGQFFMNPTQTSLLLSIGNTCMVLLVDFLWLKESKNRTSIYALIGLTIGVLFYFYPWNFQEAGLIGIIFVLFSSVGYALNLTINRHFISQKEVRTEDLIIRPMFIGSIGLLGLGVTIEGLPSFSTNLLLIILWLGAVNGGLAFYLWTWSQKYLKAFESSLLNNLMLIEIALMDMMLLHRQLTVSQITGVLLIAVMIAYVQIGPNLKKYKAKTPTINR